MISPEMTDVSPVKETSPISSDGPAVDPRAPASSSDSYWDDARRPLACLVFLVPLLAVYEIGVWWLSPLWNGIPRNGADAWLRGGLALAGLNAVWLLPAFILGGLLVWHHQRRDPWQISGSVLTGMLAESLLLAFTLMILGQVQDIVFQQCGLVTVSLPAEVPDEYVPDHDDPARPAIAAPCRRHSTARITTPPVQPVPLRRTALVPRPELFEARSELRTPFDEYNRIKPFENDHRNISPRETFSESVSEPSRSQAITSPPSLWKQLAARTILFIGAGVYEEFLFRFLLIPGLILAFTRGGVPSHRAALLAILWTSMLFSAAHYIGPAGDTFSYFTFLFRFAAGLFFASVFLSRGFGIVVGCHAAYDLLVGLMLPLAAS